MSGSPTRLEVFKIIEEPHTLDNIDGSDDSEDNLGVYWVIVLGRWFDAEGNVIEEGETPLSFDGFATAYNFCKQVKESFEPIIVANWVEYAS